MKDPTPKPERSFWDIFAEPPAAAKEGKAKEGKAKDETVKEDRSFWELFANPDVPAEVNEAEPPKSSALRFNKEAVFWALRDLPVTEAVKHFLICGMTGSGKTTAIQLYLQSIARRFRARRKTPEQLIVFDAKCDMVPVLAGLGLTWEDDNVWILNPYDARSAVWNVAEAVQTPAMARHLATLMVPEEKNSTAPYFSDGARELVHFVVMALNHVAHTNWTLRDLLCALDCREHIVQVTAHEPRTKVLADRILKDRRHAAGILSTLATKLGRFEQVAALWHTNTSGRHFSIPEFLKKPGVLVLGNDPVLRDSFWPIIGLVLKSLTQEILRGPETLRPRHWFVLDEFRALERADYIHDLLNRGRSKGASVVLGIQSIDGLVEVYQESGANDILSQCATKTFLRAGGPQTAEWAEKYFGQVREEETHKSVTTGGEKTTTTTQHEIRERFLFLASYFLNLPLPKPGAIYVSVNDIPCQRATFITSRHFDEVRSWCRPPGKVASVIPRDNVSEQTLKPWSEDEEVRWRNGLPAQENSQPQPPATTTILKDMPPGHRREPHR